MPEGGRASSAPTLNSVEHDPGRYLLGVETPAQPRGILKANTQGIQEFLGIGSDAALQTEGPRSESGMDTARRWRRPRFCNLVCTISIPPYSEIFGRHPRDFDFDRLGNMLQRVALLPSPHKREFFGESDRRHIVDQGGSNLLTLTDVSSKEEECETSPYRSDSTDATIPGGIQTERSDEILTTTTRARLKCLRARPG